MFTNKELNAMDQYILNQSSSNHDTNDQGTSENHDVDFNKKYLELKAEIMEVYNEKL